MTAAGGAATEAAGPGRAAGPGQAAGLLAELAQRRQTLAAVESLTGGLLSAMIVEVPGASAVFRGGLVVYATDLKQSLAQVPAELLAQRGPVDPAVALALARGGRAACRADWALATTGVAGPRPQGGVPVGTVYVAVAGPGVAGHWELRLAGGREQIRRRAARAALDLLADQLSGGSPGDP